MRLSSVCHTAFLKQEKKKKTKPILVNFKSQTVMFCLPQVRNLTSPPIPELQKKILKKMCVSDQQRSEQKKPLVTGQP